MSTGMVLDKLQLRCLLRLRNVLRFQTHRLQHKQHVDQHSYRAWGLYKFFGGKEDAAMLTHDLEEMLTGDLPSPIKEYLQGLGFFEKVRVPFVEPREEKLGKMCDKLELVLDLREQLEDTGHLPDSLLNIYEDESDKVLEIAKELKLEKEVKHILKDVGKPISLQEIIEYLKKREVKND